MNRDRQSARAARSRSGFSHAVVAGNTVYLAGQVGEGETLVEQFDGAAGNLVTALGRLVVMWATWSRCRCSWSMFPPTATRCPRSAKAWRKHFGTPLPRDGACSA